MKTRRFLIYAIMAIAIFTSTIVCREMEIILHIYEKSQCEAQDKDKSDAIILEGSADIDDAIIREGIKCYKESNAKKIIFAMHWINDYPENYSNINAKMQQYGIAKERLVVINTITPHPITQNEAKAVLKVLNATGIKKALLITDGFHESRSYLIYHEMGKKTGIIITPKVVNIYYKYNNWWKTKMGIHEMADEIIKTSYYLLSGHLPLSILFVNNI
jgi:hypothetical protein